MRIKPEALGVFVLAILKTLVNFFYGLLSDTLVGLYGIAIWIVLLAVVLEGLSLLFDPPHPYVLTSFTADGAIQATAEFQHKTKFLFEIGQFEAAFPTVCNNFDFVPERVAMFMHLLKTGEMKFSPYRNQPPPFSWATTGTYHLESPGFLVRNIDDCKERPVTERTGAYELSLGIPIVEVTGIRKEGGRAFVDFRWHFTSLSEVGQRLVGGYEEDERSDEHLLTAEEKSIAPFWVGSAVFADYNDGWRVTAIDLHPAGPFLWEKWEYGPEWPDPSFNWNTFDEDANRY